ILNLISDDLISVLSRLGGFSHIDMLDNGKTIADATTKALIYNKNNEKVAFLLCGYSKYGDISRRNLMNNEEFKANLNGKSGGVLLEPILCGEAKGLEYSVWPYCNQLGEGLGYIKQKVQLVQIKPLVLKWLRDMNRESLVLADQGEIEDNFIFPLQQLLERRNISLNVKEEISWHIGCLENNRWKPYFALAHNDFWKGNVLINKNNIDNGYEGLTIIDWAGGNYRGFSVYDLVRISMSLRVSSFVFNRELSAYCEIFSCDRRTLMGYLLASLAHLSNNLGEFPEERFIKLFHECYSFLIKRV
ncbi:MAG: hypothetical protein P8N24_04525, partial [Hellea sp.]|nr:hypothetical protein [Hellea sp.]